MQDSKAKETILILFTTRSVMKEETKRMKNITISESVRYIGTDDATLDLFEGQ